MATKTLKTELGNDLSQEYKFDGTNSIDVFPVSVFDSANPTNPSLGAFTIQGVTYRTELWDEGDEKTFKWELNHQYKSGGHCEIHGRVFPENDLAGTFSFDYEYFVLHVYGTTDAGGTVTMSGAFTAGDKTANLGQYINAVIDGTGLVSGDMLVGVISRNDLTYNDSISVSEFGLHIPVGKVGDQI